MKQEKVFYHNLTRIINNIMLCICAVALLVCFLATREEANDDTPTVKIEPYQVAKLEDGSKEYFFDLTSFDSRYSGMMFFTAHQSVKAYNAGRQVYSFTETGGFWGSTPGSSYNFISVNEKMLNVAVIIKPAYDAVVDQVPSFYVGSAYEMYDALIEDSLPRFVASLLVLMFSFGMFLYYIFMHKKLQLDRSLVYLAYFAFFIGLWSLNETDVAILVFDNRIFDSIIPYFCLMMVVPPFVLFFDSYLGINGKIIKRVVIFASMILFIVNTVLHFTKIAEYRETLTSVQVMLFIAVAYVVGSVIVQIIHKDFSRQMRVCAGGVSLFLIATIIDVRNYYQELGDSDKLGRYAFLIFVALLACDLIRGTNEIIEKGRHAKRLEVFALTDKMTGLYNRNAFESHADAEDNLDGIIAVVADANGLKECNDTFGHEAGDEYISLVADIFNSVFGRYGNCYRIGGDEFCCIIPAGRETDMERLKKLFKSKIYTANIEGKYKYSIGVAIGTAKFDCKVDGDFRSLVKRADACMYQNKKASKMA